MSEEFEVAIVRWTVRLAVGCYAICLLAETADRGSLRLRRNLWTAGLMLYLAHVASSFEFIHEWSHGAAWKETARQTAATTGWRSGIGLWANYAFTLFWIADIAAWWTYGVDYPRQFPRIQILKNSIFGFLVFNATVVFGPAFWRPIAAFFGLLLAAALIARAMSDRGGRYRALE